MAIVDHVGLVPETLAVISRQVGALSTLQDVLRWGFGLSPPREVVAVVVQDEFTHDVVMDWGSGLFLVFDTT